MTEVTISSGPASSRPSPLKHRPTTRVVQALEPVCAARSPCKSEGIRKLRNIPILLVLRGPEQGATFSVNALGALVGREPPAAVNLSDDTISRKHARIYREGDDVYVADLGSRNGTFVNERRIDAAVRLEDGDYVRFGSRTIAKFSIVDEFEAEALRTIFELTLRDPLTGLYNRRYFDERLRSELSFVERHSTPLALLMIDIDHFKHVNDKYGHQVGDRVLKTVADGIRSVMRPEDVLARFGGEEFVVLARGISLNGAAALAERIRRHIEGLTLAVNNRDVRVSVSIGVVSAVPGADRSAEALVVSADEALYRAKRSGRNRVCTCLRTDAAAPKHEGKLT